MISRLGKSFSTSAIRTTYSRSLKVSTSELVDQDQSRHVSPRMARRPNTQGKIVTMIKRMVDRMNLGAVRQSVYTRVVRALTMIDLLDASNPYRPAFRMHMHNHSRHGYRSLDRGNISRQNTLYSVDVTKVPLHLMRYCRDFAAHKHGNQMRSERARTWSLVEYVLIGWMSSNKSKVGSVVETRGCTDLTNGRPSSAGYL